ncbi:tripartite tricarboxylate transporter substrate binding protein [Ramlibacter sp. MAH-25]|uniref:Tripartite tricarboxylate transporter substrate binding protein n=2 Tax=Comamonadaceae TaxID=80864 RepID=A0A6N8IT07_9BURK|nr:tripartite tricarboxylate transporter substrate binding protein [Ramlibacter pinisoli]
MNNRSMSWRRNVLRAAAGLLLASGASTAWAQAWPAKPISILVGLQAGTGSDVAVRTMAERLGNALKQPIAVENLPGASGLLAAQRGAKAAPDGYSLVVLSSATVTSMPSLTPNVGFDPLKDLVPIAMVATIPSVFFVRSDFPAKTLPELVAIAKAKPGSLTYASGGNGSVQHVGMEVFKAQSGIDMVHVPYKGSVQATLDIAGGRVDGGLQGLSTVLPFLKDNRVRVLAATSEARTPLLPDTPTVKELGLGNFVYEPWTALFAPAGTPKAVVDQLNAAVRQISADAAYKAKYESMGLGTADLAPDTLARMVQVENAGNAKIIRERNIRAD